MNQTLLEIHSKIVRNCNVLDKNELQTRVVELKRELQKEYSFFEKGWIYWQLQDHYALLRDSEHLKEVFCEFVSYLKQENPNLIWWAICDMTQVLTLRLGGYGNIWYEVYKDAVNYYQSLDTVHIEMETHRAFLGIFHDNRVTISEQRLQECFTNFRSFNEEYYEHEDILYFQLCYITALIKYRKSKLLPISDLIEECMIWLERINEYLQLETRNNNYLFGSFDDMNSSNGRYENARRGFTNLLFALVQYQEQTKAMELMNLVPNYVVENGRLRNMLEK